MRNCLWMGEILYFSSYKVSLNSLLIKNERYNKISAIQERNISENAVHKAIHKHTYTNTFT